MSVEISNSPHPPIPAHLAGVRRFGLGLARWADRAAARRAARLEAESSRLRGERELRAELTRLERERERAWIEWHLHHVR